MSSRSSHHRHTSTHPYRQDPQQSTTTLASSTGEMKKTFLGRWKSVFRKEAMEALPEQGSLLSSILQTDPRTTRLPELPPIEHETLPLPRIWQGTLFDSDWERQARAVPQPPSNLPAVVLGIPQFSQPPVAPTTFSSVPLPSSTSSGTTSIYPTQPSFPHERIHTVGERQNIPPSYTGTSPYESPRDLPLPQNKPASLRPSSLQGSLRTDLPFQEGEGSLQDLSLRSRKSSISLTGIEGKRSTSALRSSGESMKETTKRESHRSTAEGIPFTTPPQTATPAPRDSLTRNLSMESFMGEVPLPRQSPPSQPRTLPQPTTPITITRALYLLSTGKLVQIPAILLHASLADLFNHFQKELLEDPNWAITPAGIDYDRYGMNYILREEASHFACTAYNMIHHDIQVEVPARYQRPQIDLPPITYTPEPMDNEPPVVPPWASVPDYPMWGFGSAPIQPSYAYPRGYGPPGTQGPSRIFAAAIADEGGPSDAPQIPTRPSDKPQPPSGPPPVIPAHPQRWVPPRYPSPPKPPDPPAPWVLDANDQGPWSALKPTMVKEPDNFNGDSNDIARFFSQYDMYFSVFNQYFRHHPHKVIFCASRFSKDAQVWWELCARELGRNVNGDQVYPAYEHFVDEVRRRFWKDTNAEIKFAQWESLRQKNFPDGDLFFQQFESLAFEAGILGIDMMMMAQVKKACHTTTKDIINASDGETPTTYQEWKRRILRFDHNWRTR